MKNDLKDRIDELESALKQIHEVLLEHPNCDQDLYDQTDLAQLAEIGGDVCDWTVMAIIARDALARKHEPENETNRELLQPPKFSGRVINLESGSYT